MSEAAAERDEVLDRFEATREEWLTEARRAASMLYQQNGGRPICIDDVRELCPPPDDVDPRVMGAVFLRSEWEKIGYKNSTRGHARVIALFRKK